MDRLKKQLVFLALGLLSGTLIVLSRSLRKQREVADLVLSFAVFCHRPASRHLSANETSRRLSLLEILFAQEVSKKGHSSVEDAQTSMELYRLVEVQWEKDMTGQRSSSPPNRPPDNCTDNDHYMDDQYWPKDLNQDCK